MIKRKSHQKKTGPTPPAPQNQMRRANFFYPTRDTDSHAKAELLKIAISKGEQEQIQGHGKPKDFNALVVQSKPRSEIQKVA